MKIDGKQLRYLRESKGMTYRQLAVAIDDYHGEQVVSAATLNKWEINPDSEPSPSKVAKVAEFFGVKVSDLTVTEEEEKGGASVKASGLNLDFREELKARTRLNAEITGPLMLIDKADIKYLERQINNAKEHLGKVFGISDEDLISAALFGGFSWAAPGSTFGKNYTAVLGDLMALKRRNIDVTCEEISILCREEDEFAKYEEKAGIYAIADSRTGELLRIGQSSRLGIRFTEHKEDLEKGFNEPLFHYFGDRSAYLGDDYLFIILAYAPEFKYSFQRDFWLNYQECRLVIERKTYVESGSDNTGKCNLTLTGDELIPWRIQWEIFKTYGDAS